MKRMVLTAALLLTACQSMAELSVDSPYYLIPVGSHLVLTKPLEIPAESATVRLQFGKTFRGQYQSFEPMCVFESNIVAPTAQIIQPDRFEIIRVRRDYNSYSAQADTGLQRVGFSHVGGGGTRQYYKTEMFLRSAKQPQILVMTCQNAWEPGSAAQDLRPLSLPEIRQALGDYFKFELAGSGL